MNRKQLTILFSFALASVSYAQDAAKNVTIPAAPASKPGQCHALVNVPAKLTSQVKDVVSQEKGEVLEVKPAEYKWVEKKVAVSEVEKTIEVIPATYKTVEEKVVVEPERKEYEVIPAKYQEVQEKIMIKPAMTVWRKSSGGAASLTGEVMRLIEVPPVYKTVTKKKLVAGPQIREIIKKPEYEIIKKKVIDKPATTREVVIPAELKTIRVKELVKKHEEIRKPTPAITQKVTVSEIVQPAQLKWQRVPCESDLNEKNIIAIQKGLKEAGYNVTPDGKFGKGSQDALEKFQESKGLAKGAITIETMKELGVKID